MSACVKCEKSKISIQKFSYHGIVMRKLNGNQSLSTKRSFNININFNFKYFMFLSVLFLDIEKLRENKFIQSTVPHDISTYLLSTKRYR